MAAYEPVSVSPGLPVCVSVESSVVGRRSSVVGLGSQTMLEFLERSNLFVVPLDGQRRWYRYHPLFAEALRYRLEQTQHDRVRTLHQRASIWYAEPGQSNDAIQHALLARDWQRAAELIEQFRFDVALGEHGSDLVNVRQWIQRLPDEVVRSRPRLCLVYAKTLLDTAPATTIDPWLVAAEATVRDALATQSSEAERVSATRPDQENLLGEVVAIRALLAAWYGDGRTALTLCQEALTLLSPGNLAARADVAYVQAMAYASIDQKAAASQSALEARALTQAGGHTSTAIISTAIIWMSFAARQMQYQGRLHEAWRMLREAGQLGEMPGGVRFASVC